MFENRVLITSELLGAIVDVQFHCSVEHFLLLFFLCVCVFFLLPEALTLQTLFNLAEVKCPMEAVKICYS